MKILVEVATTLERIPWREEFLIPMPHWAGKLTRYERQLDVRIIDGDYDPERGLLSVTGPAAQAYQPGEVV